MGRCDYKNRRQQEYGTRRGMYRSRHGIFFGVCRGMAEYLEVNTLWVRMLALGMMIFTGFWPIICLYIVAALLMKPEPVVPFTEDGDEEFYNSYMTSRSLALQRIKRTFENLERRIQRMENVVTARDYSWDQRLNDASDKASQWEARLRRETGEQV